MSSEKKIEELVVSGMVLDEHGAWVPLAEKVRKERLFIKHLEQGEILHGGVWTNVTKIPKCMVSLVQPPNSKESAVPESTGERTENLLDALEETVIFTTKEQENHLYNPPETKLSTIEYPPETAYLTEVAEDYKPENHVDNTVEHETVHDSPPEEGAGADLFGGTEFEETVMYNINALQEQIEAKKRGFSAKLSLPEKAAQELTARPVIEVTDQQQPHVASHDWERARETRKIMIVAGALIAVIFSAALVLLKLF